MYYSLDHSPRERKRARKRSRNPWSASRCGEGASLVESILYGEHLNKRLNDTERKTAFSTVMALGNEARQMIGSRTARYVNNTKVASPPKLHIAGDGSVWQRPLNQTTISRLARLPAAMHHGPRETQASIILSPPTRVRESNLVLLMCSNKSHSETTDYVFIRLQHIMNRNHPPTLKQQEE